MRLLPLDLLVHLFFQNLERQRAILEDRVMKLASIELLSQPFQQALEHALT